MPTPPVSKTISRYQPNQVLYTYGDGHTVLSTSSGMVQSWNKNRPGSVTNHKDSKSWRKPSNWIHSGWLWSFRPGGVSARRRTPSSSPGVINSVEYLGGSCWNGSIPGPYSANPVPSSFKSRCEIKALNKLKSQNVNFGVVLAEARETANTITSRAIKIGSTVRSYATSNPSGWKRVLANQLGNLPRNRWKAIPNDWLELQYGWLPLMSDVLGAAAAFQHRYDTLLPTVRVRSKHEGSEAFRAYSGSNSVGLNLSVDMQDSYKAFCSLYYLLQSPFLAKLSSLGLTNPGEIVWERLKYSFVVDWFIPIGTWLSSLDADLGYSFKSGTYSSLSRRTITNVSVFRDNPGAFPDSVYELLYDRCGASLDAFRFERTVYGSSPVPGLYFKSPISAKHIANALSLLAQSFHR